MPCFLLFTNLPASAIPKGFLMETSTVIAKAIRKPEIYVTVRIHPDQMMSHGGTTDPCANSELQSIGHMGNEENIQMSKEISEFLQQKLGIDPKRNYIKFTNLKPLENTFRTPVYVTSQRRNAMGVGLVFEADLATSEHTSHWVLQGACLILNTD